MKSWIGVVGLAAAFGLVGCGAAGDSGASNGTESPASPPITLKASELSKAFQENEAKAKLAYSEHTLVVTGKVKDIDLDFSDNPVIHLRGSGDVQDMGINDSGKMTDVNVNGLSKEVAANISKGQMLTVACTSVDEVMGSAQLSDCLLK